MLTTLHIRIIQAARLRSTTLTGPQCESNSEVNLGPLADLCGLEIDDLRKLVPSPADEPHALSILGHTFSRSLINLRRPTGVSRMPSRIKLLPETVGVHGGDRLPYPSDHAARRM